MLEIEYNVKRNNGGIRGGLNAGKRTRTANEPENNHFFLDRASTQ